jgi:hypothetical protein
MVVNEVVVAVEPGVLAVTVTPVVQLRLHSITVVVVAALLLTVIMVLVLLDQVTAVQALQLQLETLQKHMQVVAVVERLTASLLNRFYLVRAQPVVATAVALIIAAQVIYTHLVLQ